MAALLGEVAPGAQSQLPTWAQALPSLATGLVQARYQDKVLKTNLQLMKEGKSPLDVEQFQPGVKVGIDPNTRRMIIGGIAIVVLGTVLVVSMNNRKKGRA